MTELLAATSSGWIHTAWEYLSKGGVFMIPLGLASITGGMAIVFKALSLSRRRVVPARLARDVAAFDGLVATARVEPVLAEIERGESTLARLAAVAVKHRGRPQSDIVRAVESAAREETVHLHAGIGVLDMVITIAPLLGLLGTASGLVVIFKGLGETTDHLMIARGIAEALTTTIAGLAIAVPCVVAHAWFTRRIEVLTARLESLLADLAHVCGKDSPTA